MCLLLLSSAGAQTPILLARILGGAPKGHENGRLHPLAVHFGGISFARRRPEEGFHSVRPLALWTGDQIGLLYFLAQRRVQTQILKGQDKARTSMAGLATSFKVSSVPVC